MGAQLLDQQVDQLTREEPLVASLQLLAQEILRDIRSPLDGPRTVVFEPRRHYYQDGPSIVSIESWGMTFYDGKTHWVDRWFYGRY